MSSVSPETGRDSCTCITEQGTRFKMGLGQCMDIARHGPAYNPFKAPPQPGQPGELAQVDLPQPAAATGAAGDPGMVGSDRMGEVWGKKPETLRTANVGG